MRQANTGRNRLESSVLLVSRLACLDLPKEGEPVRSAEDLLHALVTGSDSRGRYFAAPKLLSGLFWWQETDTQQVAAWRDALAEQGEIVVETIGRSCYGNSWVEIASIVDPKRFDRFAGRTPIAKATRQLIYKQDGWQCVWCGDKDSLSLDHIQPASKGGSDEPENLQTLCRSCNSRKHNMDDAVAKERVLGVPA